MLVAASLSVGYWVGIKSRTTASDSESRTKIHGIEDASSGDNSKSETLDPECNMVLVVRTDLGMSPGKIAAQCSHAALACYKAMSLGNPALLRQWERAGQTKVALRCADELELLRLQTHAERLNLCARSIQDAGRTQIAAGSKTVLGIAGPARLVNQVTGKLRLL